jgi:cytoskeletal protein RodZ
MKKLLYIISLLIATLIIYYLVSSINAIGIDVPVDTNRSSSSESSSQQSSVQSSDASKSSAESSSSDSSMSGTTRPATFSFNSFWLTLPDGWALQDEQRPSDCSAADDNCLQRTIVKDNLAMTLYSGEYYPPVPSANDTELFTVSHPAFSVPFTFSYNKQGALTGVDGCYSEQLCARTAGEYNKKGADELKKLLNDMVN